jgi:hypothetical protein
VFSTQPIREGVGLQNNMKNIKGGNFTEATGRDCGVEGVV